MSHCAVSVSFIVVRYVTARYCSHDAGSWITKFNDCIANHILHQVISKFVAVLSDFTILNLLIRWKNHMQKYEERDIIVIPEALYSTVRNLYRFGMYSF